MVKGRFGFCFEPSSEAEVQMLFGALIPYIGEFFKKLDFGSEIYVDEFSGSFPDCILQVDGKNVKAEFELYSSHFRDHGHDAEKCDMIVCWKHDWYSCPKKLKMLELSKVVSKLASKYGIKMILQNRPKHPDREGRRWSIEEFLSRSRDSLSEEDYLQMKNFIDELDSMKDKGVEIQTGRGRKIPTLGIGFGKLSNMGYPLGIQADGKAWIAYKNVNVTPHKPIIEEEKAKEIRRLIDGTSNKWHNIKASNTTELIERLRKVVKVMLGTSKTEKRGVFS